MSHKVLGVIAMRERERDCIVGVKHRHLSCLMRCKCVSEALGAKAVFDVYKLHLFDVAAAF